VPPEILQTSMRTHQKYFSLRDPKTGKMAARFAVVANMVAEDGGKEIVAGNERVLRARLSDAKFFWDQDRKRTLESRVEDLKAIVFHAKLGTQYERVERIEALAGEIAEKIGADVKKAKRAARLCKADLTSGVVGEFPELQGVMGRYYALHDGEDAEVADAVRDHYKPIGPTDAVPTNKVSIVVALADKLDALTGFFLNELMPTGSSDPFALRRAALGVVTILLKNGVHIRLMQPIAQSSVEHFRLDAFARRESIVEGLLAATDAAGFELQPDQFKNFLDAAIDDGERELASKFFNAYVVCQYRLLQFITDRLKVALREKGVRHDLLDAVFVFSRDDDIVRLVSRIEALQAFLTSDDGGSLLTAYRRGANILRTEEKKDGKEYRAPIEFPTLTGSDKKVLGEVAVFAEVDPKLFALPEEKALAEALGVAEKAIAADVQAEKFVEAMGVMAGLRKPVDAFFEHVTVNDKDAKLRENRLKLLARLRATLHLVADFSKIEG
jgi:glycyl-tRNA synthetase beta chain